MVYVNALGRPFVKRPHISLTCLATAAMLASIAGCGVNNAPVVDAVADQIAAVGDELTVELRASDMNGNALFFDWKCDELPALKGRTPPPSLTLYDGGIAQFRWIPQAIDSRPAPYTFDFDVNDGRATTRRSVLVTVDDQGGSNAPVFVQPVGSGTTLQLDTQACLTLPIVANDTDATQVTLAQEDPVIDGATLVQTDPFSATWKWCPSAAQVAMQDRFYLNLSADDGKHPKTLKVPSYLIVVVSSNRGDNCPGAAPVIKHQPVTAQTTIQDIAVELDVTDDLGLKSTPVIYWSTAPPGSPPVLSKMTPVITTRTSGDGVAGSYRGVIPNPVATSLSGTTKTVYYVLVARDNDDPTGNCNHATYAPKADSFSFTVTNAGGDMGLAMCQACTSDTQCGGASDNCITMGGVLRCAVSCNSGCPTGTVCTSQAVNSIDGAMARQCVPTSGACAQ